MYDNVGLKSYRGTGSSCYIQRNRSIVHEKPKIQDNVDKKTDDKETVEVVASSTLLEYNLKRKKFINKLRKKNLHNEKEKSKKYKDITKINKRKSRSTPVHGSDMDNKQCLTSKDDQRCEQEKKN